MNRMEKNERSPIALAQANLLLDQWRSKHGTLEKVAAAHRKVMLDRVIQSLSCEDPSQDKVRLKALQS